MSRRRTMMTSRMRGGDRAYRAAGPRGRARRDNSAHRRRRPTGPRSADIARRTPQLAPPAAGENRVVFMGNSITEGWAPLFATLFPGKPYIGRGISGQTTPQMLVRFRQDVIALKPKVVVILGGTNDIAGNTGPSTLEMIEDNLDVDDGAREGERHSRRARVGAAGVRLSVEARTRAGAEDRRAQRVDEAYAARVGAVYCDFHTRWPTRARE